MRVPGREILESERHCGGGAEVREIAVLFEQHRRHSRSGVQQQEQAVPGRQAAGAVLVEARRHLEDDVARALEMRPLHVYFRPLPRELHHHRVGEHRLPQRERPEAPLHRADRHGERDLVPERVERHDAHFSP